MDPRSWRVKVKNVLDAYREPSERRFREAQEFILIIALPTAEPEKNVINYYHLNNNILELALSACCVVVVVGCSLLPIFTAVVHQHRRLQKSRAEKKTE